MTGVHSASVPIGSQAGNTIGCFSMTASTSAGTWDLSTTTSNTNSLNQSADMYR